MNRVAVFVDAGYLFAQGSVLLSGRKLLRGHIALDPGAAARALSELARRASGAELLRIYWYDGTSTGPTPQHLALAHLDEVKVRLGFVNSVGEQKGVDSLIVTDMITLARNHAISDAVLVSGDEDLRVGVQQAQELGVRVHLVGIKPSRGSQSLFLMQEADTTHEWADPDIAAFLACRQAASEGAAPPRASTPVEAAGDPLESVALKAATAVADTELAPLIAAFEMSRQVPRELDGKLLSGGRTALGRDLAPLEKKRLRVRFVELCRRRLR